MEKGLERLLLEEIVKDLNRSVACLGDVQEETK